jgi:segregation and condensation protein B
MSLKAKIEAVIYASEEPVTLAQLVGVLGEEAQAELDREVAVQQTLLNEEELEAAAEPIVEPEADAAHVEAAEPTLENPEAPEDAQAVKPTPSEATAVDGAHRGDGEVVAVERLPEAADDSGGASAAARVEKARAAKLRVYFRTVLDQLIAEYAAPESDRGLEIREVAGGFRFATKPEYHDAVRGFVKSLKPPLKLTLQALETLAVVAYKQPVTAPEISEIRGVDSSGVLGSLIARKLITTAGRKHVIGRPILYKTTKEFLVRFGLKDVAELPSIEEFEKMAGQMAEQEEIPMTNDEEWMRPRAQELAEELGPETEKYTPRDKNDVAPAANVQDGDKASVDGRLASLPPKYSEDDADDPSAEEAAIQGDEATS